MLKGLTAEQMTIVCEILKDFDGQAWFFGSRVRGDFSPTSDLDILIEQSDKQPVCFEKSKKLKDAFYHSRLPFMVNLTDKSSASSDFFRLIEPDLMIIDK